MNYWPEARRNEYPLFIFRARISPRKRDWPGSANICSLPYSNVSINQLLSVDAGLFIQCEIEESSDDHD